MADSYRTPGPPPEDALRFFRAKKLKPGFDHSDVWREEHATAFTVAKMTESDLLDTVRQELDRALAEGRTFEQFKKELTPTLQKLGWWGRQDVVDPLTGETVAAQLGSPRRLKTIYRTNMRSARAAGQWQRIERTKQALPYLLYQLGPSQEHREEHRGWHNLVLPVEHPFWSTHMPINGYGCKCHVRQVSRHEYQRLQAKGAPGPDRSQRTGADGRPTGHIDAPTTPIKTRAPEIRYQDWLNKRTGEVEQIPAGIDPGFDFNPGKVARREHAAQVLADKLPALQADIGAASVTRTLDFLLPQWQAENGRWIKHLVEQSTAPSGEVRVLGALSTRVLAGLRRQGVEPGSAAILLQDRDLVVMAKDTPASLDALTLLPQILGTPQAVLWDRQQPGLLYLYAESSDSDRLLVRVKQATPSALEGEQVITTNRIRAVVQRPLAELQARERYVLISGAL